MFENLSNQTMLMILIVCAIMYYLNMSSQKIEGMSVEAPTLNELRRSGFTQRELNIIRFGNTGNDIGGTGSIRYTPREREILRYARAGELNINDDLIIRGDQNVTSQPANLLASIAPQPTQEQPGLCLTTTVGNNKLFCLRQDNNGDLCLNDSSGNKIGCINTQSNYDGNTGDGKICIKRGNNDVFCFPYNYRTNQ